MSKALVALMLTAVLAGCVNQGFSAIADVPVSQLVVPGSDVSPAMRAYAGVWQGKWDGVWDVAIIVKNIHPNGVVDVEYRWVDNVGQAYSTSNNTVGRVDDGVLHIGNVRLKIDPTDPNVARGDLFHAANDAHRVSMFKKMLSPGRAG